MASGTIPLSLTQQFDEFGKPLSGGKLYIYQAGTVATPQDSFQDGLLTIKMHWPITMDAAGRLPQFFVADGYVKIRMTDRYGVVQREADGILVMCCCSGLIEVAMLESLLAQLAAEEKRDVQILERRGQAPDHPVAVTCP